MITIKKIKKNIVLTANTNHIICKKCLLVSICLLITSFTKILAQEYQWAAAFGPSTSSTFSQANDVATDAFGNVYIVGVMQGNSIDFDPGSGSASFSSVGVSKDIFFAKYNSGGNFLWGKSIGQASTEVAYSIAVDEQGNVYIVGSLLSPFNVDFDPGTGTANLASTGSNDIFFAKYDTDGNYLWAKSIGGAGNDEPKAISVDAAGNVYMAGSFSGASVDFNPGIGLAPLSSNGDTDIFLGKYDSNGNYQWAVSAGGVNGDVANSIGTDPSGNVFVAGSFQGMNVDFDPGSGTANLTSNGNSDIFFCKYDANGNYLRGYAIGGASSDEASSLAIDGSGYLYITGRFNGGTVDFDPGSGTGQATGGGTLFFAKYDNDANFVWAKSVASSFSSQSNSIAIDELGYIYITGQNSSSSGSDFDPGPGIVNHTANGGGDVFLAKYNPNGDYVWVTELNMTLGSAKGVAVDFEKSVYFAGSFTGSNVDFNPGPGTAAFSSASTHPSIFFGKYGCISQSANNPQQICSGDGYSINGNTYYLAGVYKDTLVSQLGCDSIVTTLITINHCCQPITFDNFQTICAGQSYVINGNTYTLAGTYQDILISQHGCDSIVTTMLTVNDDCNFISPQSFSVQEYSIAGTSVGTVLTQGGTFTYSITAGNTGNVFTINSTTGEIEAGTLSYQVTPVYELMVKVTDDLLSDSAIVTIHVTKLPEVFIQGLETVSNNTFQSYSIVPDNSIYSYRWSYAGTNVSMPDTISRTIFIAFNEEGSGTLQCIVRKITPAMIVDTLFMDIEVNKGTGYSLPNTLCPEIQPVDPCAGSYIKTVDLADIHSTSLCSPSGYNDNTQSEQQSRLYLGDIYHAALELGYNGIGSPVHYIGLWIDYNNNGAFDDNGEFITSFFGEDSLIVLSNLSISNSPDYEGPRRLRLQVRSSGSFTADEGCIVFGQTGETEDYLIILTQHDRLEGAHLVTPNNDGKNDFFVIRGIDSEAINHLVIFDHLGKNLFSKDGYANDWSGTDSSGELLPPGVYYYVFENGDDTLKGFFQLNY